MTTFFVLSSAIFFYFLQVQGQNVERTCFYWYFWKMMKRQPSYFSSLISRLIQRALFLFLLLYKELYTLFYLAGWLTGGRAFFNPLSFGFLRKQNQKLRLVCQASYQASYPTVPVKILSLRDQEIGLFHIIQERRASDIAASKLWNGRSGSYQPERDWVSERWTSKSRNELTFLC